MNATLDFIRNRFGKKGICVRLFWASMLISHIPLLVGCLGRAFGEGRLLENAGSLLTLTGSILFFALMAAGFRVLPNRRPSWRRTVVLIVLGVFFHLMFFTPSLYTQQNDFRLILATGVGVAVILAISALVQRTRKALARVTRTGVLALERGPLFYWLTQFFEGGKPLPIPVSSLSRRGPPYSSSY